MQLVPGDDLGSMDDDDFGDDVFDVPSSNAPPASVPPSVSAYTGAPPTGDDNDDDGLYDGDAFNVQSDITAATEGANEDDEEDLYGDDLYTQDPAADEVADDQLGGLGEQPGTRLDFLSNMTFNTITFHVVHFSICHRSTECRVACAQRMQRPNPQRCTKRRRKTTTMTT